MKYYPDKWTKHKLLLQSGNASALPETKIMNKANLFTMITQYQEVIIKPTTGSGGVGVILISSTSDGKILLQHGLNKSIFSNVAKMYTYLCQITRERSHLVQQRISLATIQGRPFDIRVMVQRKKDSDWTVTGSLAKVAGPGYIITNVARSKGKVLPVSDCIKTSNIKRRSQSRILERLHSISLQLAKHLHSFYPWIHNVGLDVGLDTRGKVWIIEANFNPNKELFLRLKDKSIYQRILSFSPKAKKRHSIL